MAKNKIPKEFKLSKKLDPYIKDVYKHKIGIPDLSQNWLELFHGTVIDDLFTIMHNNSDNQLKSDYVEDLLKPFGFTSDGGGLGTNILVLTNPYYPGVVFKIALDENGIADNFNDCLLQEQIPQYARVYARHPSGLVTVQERYFVMKPEYMKLYKHKILEALEVLSKDYLIADLTPNMLLNYGIDRQGNFVFIDGSDLYPLKQIKAKDRLRCKNIIGSYKNGELKYCRGKCKYNEDFSQMVCEKCGKTYIPIELRPRKEDVNMKNIFSDGFTIDDREELDRRSREAMKTGKFNPYIPDHIINNKEDEDDMAKYVSKLPKGYHVQNWRNNKGEVEKVAVKDGYHVVGIDKNGNYITKPDMPNKNKDNKKDSKTDNIRMSKKMKKVVHSAPDIIRVPQEVNKYDMVQQDNASVQQDQPTTQVVKPNNKPTEAYKAKLLEQKAKFPEDFKVYVSELIDTVGWDVIDKCREDTDAFVIMKNALHDKDKQVNELTDDLQEAYDTITSLNSKIKYLESKITETGDKLSKNNAELAYYYAQSMELEESNKKLKERIAELEENITNTQESMGTEITVKDRTVKELHNRINVLDRENDTLRQQNKKLGERVAELEDELYHKPTDTVIQNEMTNNIIQKMQSDENPNCIHYQVIEETEQDSSELPGIYLHIRGDVVEAYRDYGLPIYVCVEDHKSISLAVTAQSLQEYIFDAHDDVLDNDDGTAAIIISSEEDDEPAPNANPDISEEVNQKEIIEDLRSYTNILDEEDEDDELSDEEENNLFHRMMDNPNPHFENPDPRYEMATDGSVHI
jgi:chaperonin cofactor prefoldin